MRERESNTYGVGSEACFFFEVIDAPPEASDGFRCTEINAAGRRLLTTLSDPLEVWGEGGTGGLDTRAFLEVLHTGQERARTLWLGAPPRRRCFLARLRREGTRVILGLTALEQTEGTLRRRALEGARRVPESTATTATVAMMLPTAGGATPGSAPRQQSFELALSPPPRHAPAPERPAPLQQALDLGPFGRLLPWPRVPDASAVRTPVPSEATQRFAGNPGPWAVSAPPASLSVTPPRATPALSATGARPGPRSDLLQGLAREVVWELEVATGTYAWGETLPSVLGWSPAEAVDQTWSEACVHPSDRPQVATSFQHALEGDARIWSATFRFRRPDGAYLPIHNRALILRDPGGRPLRLVGCLVDLTESQEMEARQAEENVLRERFIGILGHDLRTPLNAISLSAQTLQRRSLLTPAQQQVVGRIQSSATRMERMIRDILDLTRARLGGGIPIRTVRFDPHALGRRVLAEARAVHPEHDLRFESCGSGRLLADPERLEQAVANLIGNACQYGPTTRPITVVSELQATQWRLSVHNWGPVIQDVRPDELFEPFRTRRTPDRNPEGLGLGLYIAREIAAAHGGHIGVTSSEELGTRFWIDVPATPAPPCARTTRGGRKG